MPFVAALARLLGASLGRLRMKGIFCVSKDEAMPVNCSKLQPKTRAKRRSAINFLQRRARPRRQTAAQRVGCGRSPE